MVLCKYFLNGNCRFGAKCVNEHLDVKQLLKSDVESAVNGNQWPLSCFGPFKEKPSIPNFIEDQSFEEIRMLCYGSKKQNFFDSFNQQFTKEVFEAKNKLKMLLTLNKDVMDVVINLYNSSEPPKGAVQQNSNPFGLSSAANPQQSTNLFGNSTTTQTSMFGSSPFGGASNATTGNSLFGGAQKSILGQSAFSSFAGQTQPQQQPQQTSGMFGSLQPQQQQPQQQQTNSFGGNIFSQAAPQTPGGASIFGTTQQPQQQSQPFGATNTSAFGQPVNSGNIFAQAAQQTQQQPAVGGNIFAQAVQQPQAQPPAFGMFSQAAQQAPPAFGAQMTTQSPFGAVQQQQQRPFFGQTQQQQQQQQQMQQQQQQQQQMQQQQQQQQQMQQQQQQQNPGNIFSTPMQKPQQQQQQPFQAQQPPSGIFASAVANSPFGPPAQPQQQQQQANIFAQAVAGFPQSQQQPLQQPMTSDRTYSKMENLRPEEIEAFQAETFELGKIPFSPPPRELVN